MCLKKKEEEKKAKIAETRRWINKEIINLMQYEISAKEKGEGNSAVNIITPMIN